MKCSVPYHLLFCSSFALACSAGAPSSNGGDGDGDGDDNGVGDGDGDTGTGGLPGGDGDAGTGGLSGDGDGDLGTGGASPGSGGSAGACTPNPAGTTVDQGDGTFFDERSCLMWMSDPWPNSGTQIGRDHVASCSTATTAGYDDWRGPDLAEMLSILEYDATSCDKWHDPPLWNPLLDVSGVTAPVMFYTATEGDGLGQEHQCAVNGSNIALSATTRLNTNWAAVCVRGTSPLTGTIAECVGTPCDY